MAFKMNGFNKPKNIDDSSVFKSNASLMMRNAALFQTGKEQDTPSDRKDYFEYDEDGIPVKIKNTDMTGGSYQPTEASVERAARQEGYYFEKRQDGTNRMSEKIIAASKSNLLIGCIVISDDNLVFKHNLIKS